VAIWAFSEFLVCKVVGGGPVAGLTDVVVAPSAASSAGQQLFAVNQLNHCCASSAACGACFHVAALALVAVECCLLVDAAGAVDVVDAVVVADVVGAVAVATVAAAVAADAVAETQSSELCHSDASSPVALDHSGEEYDYVDVPRHDEHCH